MLEENIVVGTSSGDECFVCEKRTRKGEVVIRVTFRVTFVVKVSKTVEAHVEPCAKSLGGLIDLRVRQAQRTMQGGKS